MRRLLSVIIAMSMVISAIPVNAVSYAEEHMRAIENYSEIPSEVTAQYLVGDDGTPEEIADTLAEIRRLAEEVTFRHEGVYEKAKAISGYVADNYYYDREARDSGVDFEVIALKNVIKTNRTICSGYANLTAAMLAAIGLKSVTVIGKTSIDNSNPEGNHHEWTAFWYEDENRWVIMDSGWDSGNYYNGDYVRSSLPRRYFDMKADEFPNSRRAVKAEFRDWFDTELTGGGQEENPHETETRDDIEDFTEDESVNVTVVLICVAGIIAGIAAVNKRKK